MDNEKLKEVVEELQDYLSGRSNVFITENLHIVLATCQRVLDAEEELPKRIIPDNCDKHDKCNAWTCPRCASFHSFNDALDQAALVIAKNYRKVPPVEKIDAVLSNWFSITDRLINSPCTFSRYEIAKAINQSITGEGR